MQPPLPPPEVSSELHAWLVELNIIKGKPSHSGKSHVLPGKFLANLASGEGFVELLNTIFDRHGVKQRLTAHSGQPHSTWTQVAKGLHRLSVELDDAAVVTLAGGDQALAIELLEELHTVYQHWAAQEAKRQRRPKGRRAQPQQGPNSYARPGAAVGQLDREKVGTDDTRRQVDNTVPEMTPLSKERGERGERERGRERSERGGISEPEPILPGSVEEAQPEVGFQSNQYAHRQADEVPAVQRERRALDSLGSLSADRDFTMATSAPELLGLSMIQQLRVTPTQAQELLADNGRRLLRAFLDVNERNAAHLSRWLGSLTHYGGAIAELLLLRPEHVEFTLTILSHGLQSVSDTGEFACSILAGVCAALAGTALKKSCTEWLVNSSSLGDLIVLMAQRPASSASAVSVMVSCCGESLLVLTTQYLKQTARGEQEYLAAVHNVIRALLATREMAEACHEQGVISHFLTRSLQRLGDERSTGGTLQAAALLATDLWLEGFNKTSPQEGLGDLLAALKKATQSRQGKSPQLVAFSCLSRLLSRLCDNQDPDGTPAVYRTLVYALVEAESQSAREFGTRCLLALLEKYEGVPVGILAELTAKKFQVNPRDPLSVMDIELFLVISKHPRCTERHAEMLAQVLVRCAVEHAVGRAASLPLLVIFRRFANEDCIQSLFERFVQVALTRLIQRGTPKAQINQVHELLAKIACMRHPSLDKRMRQLLQEVCKAYLSNYMELHPNLQVVLELWPEDERELNAWVRALNQESPKKRPPQDKQDSEMQDAGTGLTGSMDIRSLTPSVHEYPTRAPDSPSSMHQSIGGGATVHVAQLAKETESLRDELASAKEKQSQALAEAEALRRELRDAKDLQKKVEAEVDQLQERREEILAKRQGGKGDGKGRGKGKKTTAESQTEVHPEDAAKVEELQKAFEEPLKVLFSQYAKPRRGASGKRLEMRLEVLESLLDDLEILPTRLQKKAVPPLFKSVLSKPGEEAILVDNFMQLVPRLAKVFSASEASPITDFGVTVPLETSPAPLEMQAFLQHLEQRAETSHNSSLRVTRPVFARAKRRWVLAHARKVLKDANARLAAGEDEDHIDLPEGFGIGVRKPPQVFLAPADLPISQAERACVEILDEILSRAVGIHFLEDASSGGPRPMAFVEGHEDLATLEPREDVSAEAHRVHKRVPDSKSVGAERNEDSTHKARRDPRSENREATAAAAPAQPAPASAAAPAAQPAAAPAQARQPQSSSVPSSKQSGQPVSHKQQGHQSNPVRGRPEEDSTHKARRDPRSENREATAAAAPAQPAPASAAAPAAQPAAAPAQARQPRSVPSQMQPKPKEHTKPSQSTEPRVREEERAKPHRREHREPSVPPARSGGRAPQSTNSGQRKPAASEEPSVPLAQLSPAAAEAVKRQRRLQQHHTSAEEGKARQEALQTALGSEPVQNLVKAWEPNFRRSFEFFQRWKPSASGEMTLAGFLLLGECFGLLEKDDLKVAFKRGAGNELSLQHLPNVLMHCVARSVEVESLMLGIPEEGPVTDQEVLQSAFTDLCRHMMLNNGRSLGKCLDGYRRAGHVLEQFAAQLPEKYLAERATTSDAKVEEAKADAEPATPAEAAKTDPVEKAEKDPSKEEPAAPAETPAEPAKTEPVEASAGSAGSAETPSAPTETSGDPAGGAAGDPAAAAAGEAPAAAAGDAPAAGAESSPEAAAAGDEAAAAGAEGAAGAGAEGTGAAAEASATEPAKEEAAAGTPGAEAPAESPAETPAEAPAAPAE